MTGRRKHTKAGHTQGSKGCQCLSDHRAEAVSGGGDPGDPAEVAPHLYLSVASVEVRLELGWGAEGWLEAMEHRVCACGLVTAWIPDDLSGYSPLYHPSWSLPKT